MCRGALTAGQMGAWRGGATLPLLRHPIALKQGGRMSRRKVNDLQCRISDRRIPSGRVLP
jgi:hypothetical protein